MSNKFDTERGTHSPSPLNFFKYLLVNLILQTEVLCPYKLHDEAFPGADILSTPIFVMFSAWQAGTISRHSAGESPPIKAGRPAVTAHLVTARGGINTSWEK
jgi:hypothetical protein